MVKVMGSILPNGQYKTVLAIKFCKIRFTEFHSDERRKVKFYIILTKIKLDFYCIIYKYFSRF